MHAAERTELVVYTALEPEQHAPFKEAIEAAVPEASITWVWGQTGGLTNRILDERADPKADLVMGLAATSLIAFKALDLLLPYKPVGAEKLRNLFQDATTPYSWTGMDAYLGVICLNTEQASAERIPEPIFWADLLLPHWQRPPAHAEPGDHRDGISSRRELDSVDGRTEGLGVHG